MYLFHIRICEKGYQYRIMQQLDTYKHDKSDTPVCAFAAFIYQTISAVFTTVIPDSYENAVRGISPRVVSPRAVRRCLPHKAETSGQDGSIEGNTRPILLSER